MSRNLCLGLLLCLALFPTAPTAVAQEAAKPASGRASAGDSGPDDSQRVGASRASADTIFDDRAEALGVRFQHFNGMSGERYFCEVVGSGAALFDYDNDGDLDLYLVQGKLLGVDKTAKDAVYPLQGPAYDRLFRNDMQAGKPETLRFTEVTQESGLRADGYGMGVATGDLDGDGWTDLYLTNYGANQLWRNRGDGTFEDVTERSRTGDLRWSVPAEFFDYDLDGDLDLFVGNYVQFTVEKGKLCRTIAGAPDYCGPLAFAPEPDRLLRNRGDGTFDDVSLTSGLADEFGGALGASAADLNGDGWPDLYVSNDGTPNQMWLNQGDGTFRNEALFAGTAVSAMGRPEASMGTTVADFDADGDEDIFLTHLTRETNTLYVNDGQGAFADRTVEQGLGTPSFANTGFGTLFFDYDNDGWLDLVAANGAVRVIDEQAAAGDPLPLRQVNQLYRSVEGRRFEDVSHLAGETFAVPEVSRGLAAGDLDNDGDTDLVLANNAGPARLLINRVGQRRSWLGVRLVQGSKDRDALGARVEVRRPGQPTLWRRVATGGSYASASDPRLLFGLGEGVAADTLEVVVSWPGGQREAWQLEPGRYHLLRRGKGQKVSTLGP